MHYTEIVQIVKKKVHNDAIRNDIDEILISNFLFTERTMMIGHYLKHLEEKDKDSYQLIKQDVNTFLEYWQKEGLLIK